MSLKRVNKCPKFTKYLVSMQAFELEPLSVIDVGARGGFGAIWSHYGNQVKLIGFETDSEECDQLNSQAAGTGNQYFSVALHRDIGKRTFYVTQFPAASGFYKPDARFMDRILDGDNLNVMKEIEIETIDLDSFLQGQGIRSIDYIDLDVEGAELDVLEGAYATLARSVLALSIEVEFFPVHQNQPLFSDVDSFVRTLGFSLFDLSQYRHSTRVLPFVRPSPGAGTPRWAQVLWGQALYLRDAVNEIETRPSTKLKEGWDEMRVLKLASIMELYCLSDCAIELIQVAGQAGLLRNWDTNNLIDLLVPDLNAEERVLLGTSVSGGKRISYDEYLKRVAAVGFSDQVEVRKGKKYYAKQLLKKFLPLRFRTRV